MVFTLKLTKRHNSVRKWVELRLLYSAHCLIMFNACTKFHEYIYRVLELLSGHDFHNEIYNRA